MKKNTIPIQGLLWSLLLFYLPADAQYKGGTSDGFDNGGYAKQNITDPAVFKGGSNDGFAFGIFKMPNITDDLVFKGGAGDGFAFGVFNRKNITDDLVFKGGANDGFTVAIKLYSPGLRSNPISLNGKWFDNTAIISWQISRDYPVDKFIIERSFTGKDFVSIDTVAAKSMGKTMQGYEFSDTNIAGIHHSEKKFFYRLKSLYENQEYASGSIINLAKSGDTGFNISLYPNPAHSVVNIMLQGLYPGEMLYLTMTDIVGRVVGEKKIQINPEKLNTMYVTSGQYFINIYNNHQLIKTIPVIIQH